MAASAGKRSSLVAGVVEVRVWLIGGWRGVQAFCGSAPLSSCSTARVCFAARVLSRAFICAVGEWWCGWRLLRR